MTNKIPCEYRTHKHVPTRSCYQLILEVSEDLFPLVCDALGFPKAGESVYVNIELSTPENIKEISYKPDAVIPISEKSEGDKLRERACILCGEKMFWDWLDADSFSSNNIGTFETPQKWAAACIYKHCNIKSRTELVTNKVAQMKFRALDQQYKDWQYGNQYEDNLSR